MSELTLEGLAKMAMESSDLVSQAAAYKTDDPGRYRVVIATRAAWRTLAVEAAQRYINEQISTVYSVKVE